MRVLITGIDGFIGSNLKARLNACNNIETLGFSRNDDPDDLEFKVLSSDAVIHLAGVNRSDQPEDFYDINCRMTEFILDILKGSKKPPIFIHASTVKVAERSHYGHSKKQAEDTVFEYSESTKCPTVILRLPGVFGKWCRPDYNSVVATFCHRLHHNLPLKIHDANVEVTLAYIDHVIDKILEKLFRPGNSLTVLSEFENTTLTVGHLHQKLTLIHNARHSINGINFDTDFDHNLYATYLSYGRPESLATSLVVHEDVRGKFFEFYKTKHSGQISFFTIERGATRGGHYHNTKCERFLLLDGTAEFGFENVCSSEQFKIKISASEHKVIDSPPGWSHYIKNIGEEVCIVGVWASEVFDPENPDTFRYAII